MTIGLWLKLVHLTAVIVWLGGGVMLAVIGLHARRSGDARVIGQFASTLPYVGLRLLMPAVVVVLVTGVWLVVASPAWAFTQTWIHLALAAFAVAFLIGVIYLSRVGLRLQQLAAQPDSGAGLREALGRWIVGYTLVLIVLLFAVWDMVVKPGL